jgi:hypothetical protein
MKIKIWWGNRIAVAPGPRLPPSPPQSGVEGSGAAAIRGHTPSSKDARLSRSTCAREAPHLRNATSVECRFAAIVKKFLNIPFHKRGRCGRLTPRFASVKPLRRNLPLERVWVQIASRSVWREEAAPQGKPRAVFPPASFLTFPIFPLRIPLKNRPLFSRRVYFLLIGIL